MSGSACERLRKDSERSQLTRVPESGWLKCSLLQLFGRPVNQVNSTYYGRKGRGWGIHLLYLLVKHPCRHSDLSLVLHTQHVKITSYCDSTNPRQVKLNKKTTEGSRFHFTLGKSVTTVIVRPDSHGTDLQSRC